MITPEDAALSAFFGPTTVALIRESVWAAAVTRYTNYAFVTVMVWDMLLTFSMEVELIWSSRIGLLKVIFLFNRYVTPAVLGVNIWTLTGLAKGLTSTVCRNWFTIAFLVQLICTVIVSLLIAIRLWAWYEMSTRTLYLLLLVWLGSFTAALTFMAQGFWMNRSDIVHVTLVNVCTTVHPVIWQQWLPGTVEHGIYLCFLVINAMATPRSARSTALALLYREGIVFYSLTFSSMLSSLLIWRYASRMYIGFGLYTSWIVLQVSISRLLLDVKHSQVFRRRSDMKEPLTQSPSLAIPTAPHHHHHHHHREQSRVVGFQGDYAIGPQSHSSQSQSMSYPPLPLPAAPPAKIFERSTAKATTDPSLPSFSFLPQRSRRGSLLRRIWWLSPRWQTASGGSGTVNATNGGGDIHIDVSFDEPELLPGALKVSRLGRYDEWL